MKNTKSILETIVEERITDLPTDRQLKQHTRWIAAQSTTPIIRSIFGTWLNEYCHVREGYDAKFLHNLNN